MRDEPLSESFKTYYAMGYPGEPPAAARSKSKNEDESFRADLLVMRIAELCHEEIKWVNDCSEEDKQQIGNYNAEDRIYFKAYKKAFGSILKIIGNSA